MHLKNENETREAIDSWRPDSPGAQLGKLHKALEGIELDRMYYEQKESARGVERCGSCLALLRERIDELENGC
ncbi:MAG: hypothetical protein LC633_06325 [Desulfobulbaceae bacterium]|nr:hypothetical protein [Desulfobulbaceae bacterium]